MRTLERFSFFLPRRKVEILLISNSPSSNKIEISCSRNPWSSSILYAEVSLVASGEFTMIRHRSLEDGRARPVICGCGDVLPELNFSSLSTLSRTEFIWLVVRDHARIFSAGA
ncbi:unnamed protein product [Dicrocoelium dendriticum]|nr:unnamed protein product [Dicrocoelium dendriticum]